MSKRVQSIVIVGGGSSGWMSASFLSKTFFDLKITLVESKRIPVIGVGEATIPSLMGFLGRIGFRDWRTWLQECNGTIKAGIRFDNWYEKGDHYWHPFEALDYLNDHTHAGHAWLSLHGSNDSTARERNSFYESFHVSYKLNCVQKRGPVVSTFAFHLNADRFGELLRKHSPTVRHVLDDVVDIQLNEAGEIKGILTAENGLIEGDLFLDCTGFQRRLITQVDPQHYFESNASSLFCDRAVVIRFPYESTESRSREMDPFVTATAQSSGWIWKIPLWNRISSGYVYCSAFQSDSQAEDELRRFWGYERTKDCVPHKVKFQTGKLQNLWVKNCVAIGLAGGFVEPLESTGLAITQLGLEMLAAVLDSRCYDEVMRSRYNTHLQKFCLDIVQFITAHYCLTNREDTEFWKAVKNDTCIPDGLAARLDIFKRLLPTTSTRALDEVWAFRDFSWFAVLLGMNFPFETPHVNASMLFQAKLIREQKAFYVDKLTQKARSHVEFLRAEVYEKYRIPINCSIQIPQAVGNSLQT